MFHFEMDCSFCSVVDCRCGTVDEMDATLTVKSHEDPSQTDEGMWLEATARQIQQHTRTFPTNLFLFTYCKYNIHCLKK